MWLKLTRPRGDPVWVDGDKIASFQREDPFRTQIETGYDRFITCRETPDELCDMLGLRVATMYPRERTEIDYLYPTADEEGLVEPEDVPSCDQGRA